MPKFKIVKLLASVFTPDLHISNSLSIANALVDLMGKYVGDEPTILPIQQNAPPEIPRILFESPNKKWALNVSAARSNLFYHGDPFSTDAGMPEAEFASVASTFFPEFLEVIGSRIQRIAFVSEKLSKQDDALNYIQKRFCNKEQITEGRPFFGPESFELHSLKKYTWEDFDINSWVRMKVQSIKTKDGESVPAILLTNDLNTYSLVEAKSREFSKDEITRFFDKISEELRKIVQLYFD